MKLTKPEVARRLLGSATHLFLKGADPVSTHVLASAAYEIVREMAARAGSRTFIDFVKNEHPEAVNEGFRLNLYYNAFKHGDRKRWDGDNLALSLFEDSSFNANVSMLFFGWNDFGQAGGLIPVEAVIFLLWCHNRDGDRRGDFPNLTDLHDVKQLEILNHALTMRKWTDRLNTKYLDTRPLLLS
jgi:hypothetical protein